LEKIGGTDGFCPGKYYRDDLKRRIPSLPDYSEVALVLLDITEAPRSDQNDRCFGFVDRLFNGSRPWNAWGEVAPIEERPQPTLT
jgi:hypothetical protein